MTRNQFNTFQHRPLDIMSVSKDTRTGQGKSWHALPPYSGLRDGKMNGLKNETGKGPRRTRKGMAGP